MTIDQYHRLALQLLDAEVSQRQSAANRSRTAVAEAAAGRLPFSAELMALDYAARRKEYHEALEAQSYLRELFAGIERAVEASKTAGDVSRAVMTPP